MSSKYDEFLETLELFQYACEAIDWNRNVTDEALQERAHLKQRLADLYGDALDDA